MHLWNMLAESDLLDADATALNSRLMSDAVKFRDHGVLIMASARVQARER
jgi:hypothetical protein